MELLLLGDNLLLAMLLNRTEELQPPGLRNYKDSSLNIMSQEKRSSEKHSVAQAGLKPITQPRLGSNSKQSSCISLLNSGIIGTKPSKNTFLLNTDIDQFIYLVYHY